LLEFLRDHHLLGTTLSLVRQCAWLVVLIVLFVPLEQFLAVHREPLFRKSTPGDLGYYFISGLLPQLVLVLPLSVAAYVAYHFVPWRLHAAVAAWPIWLRGLTAFVVADFGFYWGHRWAHDTPLLWRFHALHHAPEHIYFLISARGHPVDNAFIRLCGLVPIYLLGLGAPQGVKGTLIATLLMLLVTLWGFFIHANIRWRLGPLEWLLSTPRFHHWHHTRSAQRDCNYASMLPVWDRMFGTHYLPRQWPSAYGIDTTLPRSVIAQLIHPFQPSQAPLPERAQISQG
jgi:sterol desaturase/sphingolipid hydroxylase (fatty acid hydroxylase superfamily)